MILQYVIKMLIPAVNYGAFYDQNNTHNIYHQIDLEICNFMISLLNIKSATEQEMLNFCVLPHRLSGL
jgi:hypothetical protein